MLMKEGTNESRDCRDAIPQSDNRMKSSAHTAKKNTREVLEITYIRKIIHNYKNKWSEHFEGMPQNRPTHTRTHTHIRGCIQKFQDWPPGARTANGTVLCH
jgi:hypothetical protein